MNGLGSRSLNYYQTDLAQKHYMEGCSFFDNNQHTLAIEKLTRGIDTLERGENPDYKLLAKMLNKLGNVYFALKDYNKALNAQLKAYDLNQSMLSPSDGQLALDSGNIALCYKKLNESQKAIDYLTNAINIQIQRSDPYNPDTEFFYISLGNIYFEIKKYQYALDSFMTVKNIQSHIYRPDSENIANTDETILILQLIMDDPEQKEGLELFIPAL